LDSTSETTSQAAQRETIEEAGANIELHALFSIINVAHVHQVHLFYRATLKDLHYQAGDESVEVRLFRQFEIPWDDIAFPTITHTLQFFFDDLSKRALGQMFSLHAHDIAPRNAI
jgi:8-oxo-dGTP pyrophosphatase MutT (NUDIX family)